MLGAFLAAGVQAITGMGFSLVLAPILALTIGADVAVPMINAMAAGLNVGMLVHERNHARWRDAVVLFIPAAVVIPIVGIAIRDMSTDTLSVLIGAGILLSAALMAFGARAPALTGVAGTALTGGISGAMNVASGVGGPPAAMYAINAGWPPESIRPTLQIHFLAMNIASLAVRELPTGHELRTVVALVPAIAVGWFVGARLAKQVDGALVRRLTLAVAAAGGLAALVRGLTGA